MTASAALLILSLVVILGTFGAMLTVGIIQEARLMREQRYQDTLQNIEYLEYALGLRDPEPGRLPPGRPHYIRK